MKIAIMQPTYLPWIGYFDLIDQCDTFVFLDNVQFEKQSWQQRNRIKTSQGWQWLSVPIIHKFPQQINEVEINGTSNWQEKHWKSIAQSYGKVAWWDSYRGFVEGIYRTEWRYLADLNIFIITEVCKHLSIGTSFVKAGDLEVKGGKVERLIGICHVLKADVYLSPPGSSDYIEQDNRFGDEGVLLAYHHYEHPTHKQLYGDFVSHLSIIDLLLNEGPQTLDIIRSGRK